MAYKISKNNDNKNLPEKVILPSIYEGEQVTTIAANGFAIETEENGNKVASTMKSIIIPESITIVEANAFNGCTGLNIDFKCPYDKLKLKEDWLYGCTDATINYTKGTMPYSPIVEYNNEETKKFIVTNNNSFQVSYILEYSIDGNPVVTKESATLVGEGRTSVELSSDSIPTKSVTKIKVTFTANNYNNSIGYGNSWYNSENEEPETPDVPEGQLLVAYVLQKTSGDNPVRETIAAIELASDNIIDSGIFTNNQYQIKLAAIRSSATVPTVWLPYAIKDLDKNICVYDTANNIWIANGGWVSNGTEKINETTYYSYTKQYLGTQIAELTYRFYKGE